MKLLNKFASLQSPVRTAYRGILLVALCPLLLAFLFLAGCQQRQQDKTPAITIDTAPVKVTPSEEPPLSEGEISLARNFYFIFDGSGSMRDRPDYDCGGDQTFRRKIDGAKWAVAEFLKKVPNEVNLGLYVFDGRRITASQREMVPLAPDNLAIFLQAVNDIEAGGGTPLAEAIRFGTDALARQRAKQLGYGEFRLIVVTDGLAEEIPAAAEYATKHAIPIYAIGLCIKEDHPLRRYAISYRAANNFQDLAKALEATVGEAEYYDPKTFEALGLNK